MIPALTGMVHLAALPGSPRYDGRLQPIEDAAVADAITLAAAGFDGVIIENFGDSPFFADDVPDITIAAVTRMALAVAREIDLPIGINILRNDALGALAIAAASGATMIRVNVLSGSMFTDQGLITGLAADVARERERIAPEVQILADVFVKHATPPAGLSLAHAAEDLATRGGADAVIVSGHATGSAVDAAALAEVRAAVGETPLLIGSGAAPASIGALLELADGVIVGSSLKPAATAAAPIDLDLARKFAAAARHALG